MIPITSTDIVKHKDEDGITYKFRPKTGRLEREMLTSFSPSETDEVSAIEYITRRDAFIKKILIGWEGAPMPEDGDYASVFTNAQMMKLLEYWNKASDVSVEEKKS
jgi:hypothetical protein